MPREQPDAWPRVLGAVADVVRFATLVSAVVAWVAIGMGEGLLFLVLFAGLLLPRFTKVPRPFDAAFGITLLAASWSTVLDWYEVLWWWDLLIHFIANGAIAAMAYLVFARLGVVRDMHDRSLQHSRTALAVLATSFGLALGGIWEFMEWSVENLTDIEVHVGYDDTLGDMAVGGLGSVVAGLALIAWSESGHTVKRGTQDS